MTESILPGVPRIESPVFANDTLADLSEEERRVATDLNANGYAVIDFPDPAINARIDRIVSNLSSHFDVDFGDDRAVRAPLGRVLREKTHDPGAG